MRSGCIQGHKLTFTTKCSGINGSLKQQRRDLVDKCEANKVGFKALVSQTNTSPTHKIAILNIPQGGHGHIYMEISLADMSIP